MLTARVLTDAAALEALEPEWRALLARSATNEATLSPAWTLAWWRVFGPHDGRALRALAVHDGARLAGLAPLLARTHRYAPGLPFRRLELLCSGEDEADEVCSDYIGVVAERGAEEPVAEALARALADGALGPWDELVLPAMSGESALPVLLAEALRARGLDARVEVTGVAPYIPLPETFEAYLAALPGSRRYLVRRSLRDFEAWAGGDVRVERATDGASLARGRRVLAQLHAARWEADGRAGVFAAPRFAAFHDAVMPALLAEGALELSWIVARGEPVAAAYNVAWNGRVAFYQSGRRMDLPPKVRPGIVLHAYAIRDAIEARRREYDFLAGTSRYKMDLALATRPLVRLRAARPSVREAARRAAELALDQARTLRDRLRPPRPPST